MKRKRQKQAPPRKAATPARPSLGEACARAVSRFRGRKPRTVASKRLAAGGVAPEISLPARQAQELFQIAFANASGATNTNQIVWVAGEHELLVNAGAVQMAVTDGFVLVSIPVFTEQSGNASVIVPFAVGRAGAPQGLIMATETLPRGPSLIVERWGEPLIAAAWRAVVDMTSGLAAAAGVDERNQALLPATFVAHAKGIRVTPQALHRFDSNKP